MATTTLTCSNCSRITKIEACPNCKRAGKLTAIKNEESGKLSKMTCSCGHSFDKYPCKYCGTTQIYFDSEEAKAPDSVDAAPLVEALSIWAWVIAGTALAYLFVKICSNI